MNNQNTIKNRHCSERAGAGVGSADVRFSRVVMTIDAQARESKPKTRLKVPAVVVGISAFVAVATPPLSDSTGGAARSLERAEMAEMPAGVAGRSNGKRGPGAARLACGTRPASACDGVSRRVAEHHRTAVEAPRDTM